MNNNKKLLALAVALAISSGITACNAINGSKKDNTSSVAASSKQQTESAKLNSLLTEHFNESLKRNPVYATFVGVHDYNDQFGLPISDENRANDLAFEKRYLKAINDIDETPLTGQDWLSYKIFKRDREMAIKGSQFDTHLTPFNQMWGVHNFFAMLGSGSSAQPFNTYQNFKDFEKRAAGFAIYMDSAIAAMREGMEKGVVLPKPIVNKIIPQLQAHIVEDVTESVFYGPLNALEENSDISDQQKQELQKSYPGVIKNTIIPAYQRTYDFIVNEYQQAARDSVGLSALPNGKARYEHRIAINTTLSLSAEEIHEFGLQEVERILSEMTKVKEQVGFDGDLQAFFQYLKEDEQFYWSSEQEVIDAYTNVKNDINQRVGKLFEVFPKSDYEVRAVEAYRAASSAGASYQRPAPDGSRPGIFYINTHNLKAQPKFLMETLSIHEAAPGHHFQIAIQQEVEGLPKFRKFGGYTVFSEGWALYAESLGKELGLFTDPYQWYGRLADEQLRAMRLVVDTGLHAFGWTREQAIDFMQENSSMAESDIVSEVERYIAIPGQALSYKVGERKIRQLREAIREKLGDKFDIKKFHTQVLIDGAVPMPILEAKLQRWADSV
ncbi:MAG: DUF885 family protein [Aestuariibacter sp.]